MHVQIVRFKLRPGASREAFLELTEQMIASLKRRNGFIAYELYEGAGEWFDRIAWESATHAQDGLNDFLSTPIAAQIMQLVENGHASFFGDAVMSA